VRAGRRIYDNLCKAMAFVLAVHVPIAGLSLLPLLLGWPLIFTPVHIAFLELLIDPVCSIAFEAEPAEPDLMRRRPRAPGAPLFSLRLIATSLAQGGLVLLLVAGFALWLHGTAVPEAQARAAVFTALVCSNVGLIVVSRAADGAWLQALRRPNPTLWRTLAATAVLLAVALWVPAVRELFRFAPMSPALAAQAAGVALVALLALGLLKRLSPRA
jgi:P-type Ca2+ transporter type 2C